MIVSPPLRSQRRRTTGRGLRRLGAAGFTIAETMLAAFVMALGIATSLTALQAGLKATDTARNMTLAGQIIQSEIEIIRLENWSQITALPASATIDPTSTISTSSGSSLDTLLNTIANRFTVTRTVADITGRSEIKVITISVTWSGIDGRSHNLTYQTRYAKDGLADYLYVSH